MSKSGKSGKPRQLPYQQMNTLLQEQRLIALMYHRNKNQHRVARWWAQFSTLKRVVRDIVHALQNLNGRNTNMLFHVTTKFVRTQARKMYTEFNEVIALCQFPTLGVVLVGLLSRIFSLVTGIREYYADEFAKFIQTQAVRPERTLAAQDVQGPDVILPVGDEEIGEVITEESLHTELPLDIPLTIPGNDDMPPITIKPSTKKKSSNKSKSKKKKSKSAIDSIFG